MNCPLNSSDNPAFPHGFSQWVKLPLEMNLKPVCFREKKNSLAVWANLNMMIFLFQCFLAPSHLSDQEIFILSCRTLSTLIFSVIETFAVSAYISNPVSTWSLWVCAYLQTFPRVWKRFSRGSALFFQPLALEHKAALRYSLRWINPHATCWTRPPA